MIFLCKNGVASTSGYCLLLLRLLLSYYCLSELFLRSHIFNQYFVWETILSGIRLFKKLPDTDILFFLSKRPMNLGRKKQSLVVVLLLGNVKFLAVTLSFDWIWILTVVRDTAKITTILLPIFSF